MPYLVTGEDNLRVDLWTDQFAVRASIHWRMLTADRNIQVFTTPFAATSATPSVRNRADYTLGPGLLLNLGVVQVEPTGQFGHCFIRVQLVRGLGAAAVLLGTLISDYVTDQQSLGWPGSPIRRSVEADQTGFSQQGTDPAAGVEFSEAVPGGVRWELAAVLAVLTTSATIATRRPKLIIDTGVGGFSVAIVAQTLTLPASSSATFGWYLGMPLETALPLGVALGVAGLPSRLVLFGGYRVRSVTDSLQAGDNWDAPIISGRQLFDLT